MLWEKRRFTEHQIISTLKKQEAGISIKDLSRVMGISEATIYYWQAKYGGKESCDVSKLRD